MSDRQTQGEWTVLEEQQAAPTKTPRKRKKRGKRARKKRLRRLAIGAAGLAAVYLVLVFSHIPIIEKWRTIYIETAMGTMNHQWLATLFLPQSVIDDVMQGRLTVTLEQEDDNSSWKSADTPFPTRTEAVGLWDEVQEQFTDAYAEIDTASFQKYLESHSRDEVLDEDGYLMIDAADYDADETGIQTVSGDDVCAIDTRHGIVIVSLKGSGYAGRLAIIKDPAQVQVAAASSLGSSGSYLDTLCEKNDAILGINASGFSDPEGTGNGGDAFGLVLANGVPKVQTLDESMKIISLNGTGHLEISNTLPDGARDAVQFSPALIINGTRLISGSSGWGLQPRSAIGQTQDGQILMAIVDGRQPGYSVGITLGDLTDILYQYGAYQACNLDGGSSSVMYYNGRIITHSSAANPERGRHLPDGWIVKEN